MCVSCGCLRPDDDHGVPGHLTMDQLEAAARAAGITVAEVVDNIRDTVDLAAGLNTVGT